MTRKELTAFIAAILTTLADMDTDCSESTCYIAVGMDMERWQAVRDLIVTAGLVTIKGYRVALTDAGRALADKCNAVLASS